MTKIQARAVFKIAFAEANNTKGYPASDLLQAIGSVLCMETINSISKQELRNALQWLYDQWTM